MRSSMMWYHEPARDRQSRLYARRCSSNPQQCCCIHELLGKHLPSEKYHPNEPIGTPSCEEAQEGMHAFTWRCSGSIFLNNSHAHTMAARYNGLQTER